MLRVPFAKPVTVTKDYASTLSIDDGESFLIVGTNLTGTLTIDINNMNDEVPDGTEIMVKGTDDGSGRTVSFGSNFTGKNKTLSANATFVARAVKQNGGYYLTSFEEVA